MRLALFVFITGSLLSINSYGQMFYFSPYLMMKTSNGEVEIGKRTALKLIKNKDYKDLFFKSLGPHAEEFINSVSGRKVSYNEYSTFLNLKEASKLNERPDHSKKGRFTRPCDNHLTDSRPLYYHNNRLAAPYRNRLVSNQLDRSLEEILQKDSNEPKALRVAFRELLPGTELEENLNLSRNDIESLVQGIEHKQSAERVLEGGASEEDIQKTIDVVTFLNIKGEMAKEVFEDSEIDQINVFKSLPIDEKKELLASFGNGDDLYTTAVGGVVAAAAVAAAAAYAVKSVKGEYCLVDGWRSDLDDGPDPDAPPPSFIGGNIPRPRTPRDGP